MPGEIDEPRFPAEQIGPRLIARERRSAERNGRFDRAQSISILRYANQTCPYHDGFTVEARINRSFDIGVPWTPRVRAMKPTGHTRLASPVLISYYLDEASLAHRDSCQSQITLESRAISVL